jgi:tetratricopeptide (TPR) repeat protein
MKNSFPHSIILVSIILLTFSYLSFFAEEVPQLQEVKQNQESTKIKLEISKYTQEGQAFLKIGKTNEAQQMSQKIKNLSESSPESYYLSGAIQYILSNYTKAGKELETAIRTNPGHDQSLFLYGMIFLRQNKIEQAIVYLERACNEANYNPFYRFNLAIAYFALGKFEKAKIEAESTVRLKENYHKAKFLLASSLYKLNKKTESYAIIKDLYDKNIDRNDIQILYLKLSTEEGKNYSEVIQILAKKNKLSLEEKKILAQVFMEEGEYLKAIQFYKMIFDSGMDTEEDNINYLKSMIMIGKTEEAEKLFSAYNKKSHSEKKILIDTYYTTLEKKYFLSQVYQPYPL